VYEPHATAAAPAAAGSAVWPVDQHETRPIPCRFLRPGAFNRLTLQVEPDRVRLLVNGLLFHEDRDPSPTSPWLALYARGQSHAVFRGLTLTGSPQIPRAVPLTHGDHLEGWISAFYGETQPRREGPGPRPARPRAGSLDTDWWARDGEIHGRRRDLPLCQEPEQSRLYYHRPLRDGETVRYEFYYQPGEILVHPSLDRLAFLLEPDGVRIHWITNGWGDDWTCLTSAGAVVEPQCRRGPKDLPLRAGAWNALQLAVSRGKAMLELNGVPIYERPLEPTNDRLFGFFHYKDRTAVRVRNVLLTGDWPTSLTPEQRANLAARSSPPSRSRAAERALIGERFLGLGAARVLAQAQALPVGERFDRLRAWVLPDTARDTIRLHGDFTPLDVAPPSGRADSRRMHTGGELEAPVLELVAAARELGKLDDLAEEAQRAAKPDPRGSRALLALVRIAQRRDGEAAAALTKLLPLCAGLPEGTPDEQFWPEFVAAAGAVGRTNLHAPAMALLDHLVGRMRARDFDSVLAKHVRHAQAVGQVHGLPQPGPFGADPGLLFWQPVVHASAATRGSGLPRPHWTIHGGELRHYPGHQEDCLYLAVPLHGNFDVTCELSAFGFREMRLSYGGLRVAVQEDLVGYDLAHFTQSLGRRVLNPPLQPLGDWYTFRLVVRDGLYTVFVNNRQIHAEQLPAQPDPWLLVRQFGPCSGGLRNLRITGRPTIPEALELSRHSDLTGWLGHYYDEAVTVALGRQAGSRFDPPYFPDGAALSGTAAWEKRRDEIFGRARREAAGTRQESLLQYHRPLLEDGVLDYEFYYEPGKVMTHPALDRLVFLLEPAGVKVHWLTDAQYDRTGRTAYNATEEKANRRGPAALPLQKKAWNRLQLALRGDRVTLRLNGVEIYERDLEATNQRVFGLFHYADETEVRVRGVTYRGQWPRQLPGDQELFLVRPVGVPASSGK
jgi:hypothetical protein